MALRKTLTFAAFALGLTLAFGATTFAQQPQPRGGGDGPGAQRGPGGPGGPRRGGPRERGFGLGGPRVMRELNLSDAQRQQARAIIDRYAEATRTQREQLRELRGQARAGNAPADIEERARALREQLHESGRAMRAELLGILTEEQRTRLGQIEAERKARRDAIKQRRGEGGGAPPEIQQ